MDRFGDQTDRWTAGVGVGVGGLDRWLDGGGFGWLIKINLRN